MRPAIDVPHWPSRIWKSEALKVAHKFLFEFCLTSRMVQNDWTIFMTAHTGTAAMTMWGCTIIKSACVRKPKPTEEMKAMFKGAGVLVIDEVSFVNDQELQLLHECSKAMRDQNNPFGGFSVVFSGDFCQLPQLMAKESDLLHSEDSSGLWNDSINAVMILTNEHQFKNDPRHGRMMNRMWEMDLSTKDQKLMNNARLVKKGKLFCQCNCPPCSQCMCMQHRKEFKLSSQFQKMHSINSSHI